jgi:hypothetical protein
VQRGRRLGRPLQTLHPSFPMPTRTSRHGP